MRMLACLERFGVRCRYTVQNETRSSPSQAARVAIWLPLHRGAIFVFHPASQRSHVRAITCDLYFVGRGNARLTSQGDCRTGQLTRFAEGSRGSFPLLPFFGIAGRRCRWQMQAARNFRSRAIGGPS